METVVGKTLERTFELVASTPNLAADTALASVLTTADEPIQRLALNKLFERGNPTGLALLVGHSSRLHDGLKRSVLDRIDDLHEATRLAVASESVEARLGAIELIRRGRSSHLAYLLSEALARQCPRTKEAAATILLELVRHALERRERTSDRTDSPHPPAPNGDQEARLVVKRLADAANPESDDERSTDRPTAVDLESLGEALFGDPLLAPATLTDQQRTEIRHSNRTEPSRCTSGSGSGPAQTGQGRSLTGAVRITPVHSLVHSEMTPTGIMLSRI